MSEYIHTMSLVEVASAIRDGRITAVQATEACLAAIQAAQPCLNCFIDVEADLALEQARARDADLADGKTTGSLHGVPLAHKDLFERAGRPANYGSAICRDHVATETATIMSRLDAAGAVTIGRLNQSEFAIGGTGHNDAFGDCRNPWDTERITGGSSSGSGSAVAARLVYASMGSDTGGSVRLPAALCGVVGLKTTYGRVSRHGGFPNTWSFDTFGPLARTAEDAAVMLQAIAGPDEADPMTAGVTVPDFCGDLERAGPRLDGLRIGLAEPDPFPDVDGSLRPAMDSATAVLADLGASLVPLEMPDTGHLHSLCETISKAEVATVHGEWMRTRADDYATATYTRIETGFHVPAATYLQAKRAQAPALTEFTSAVFSKADVLLTPVVGFPTPTLAEIRIGSGEASVRTFAEISRWTRWVNYLGVPALSVPCGFTNAGMPVAFQLIARPFAEGMLLRVGAAYQGATDWHHRAPQA